MKRISSLGYRLASLQMLAEIRDRLLEILITHKKEILGESDIYRQLVDPRLLLRFIEDISVRSFSVHSNGRTSSIQKDDHLVNPNGSP